MSDTPRTDAFGMVKRGVDTIEHAEYVTADFAHQLERDLAERDRLLRDLHTFLLRFTQL